MINQKKRGQVTLFIVIGIIMLIAVGLFFVFRQLSIPGPDMNVPDEVVPVKLFVEACLEDTLKDAIVLAGIQGGYTEIPEDLAVSPFGHLQVAGPFKTPMWYYSGVLRIPEIFEIEEQLNNYVNKNIELCIQNFTGIEALTVNILSEPKFSTQINKNDVSIVMNQDIEIVEGDERFEWNFFSTEADVKLSKAYEIAKQVMEKENENMFLETVTIDLMALDPEVPLTDFRFDTCHRLTWSERAINTRLKDTLYYNMPRLRVDRTRYEKFDDDEDYQKNHFLMDAINQDEKDITVGFRYDKDWSMLLNARPSDGDILKSNSGKGFAKYMSFLCMNMYHFTYDIEYPVEIIIREGTSFDGEGYVFRFGTPVIIKQNQGNRVFVGEPEFEVPRYDTDMCETQTDEVYDIRAIDPVTNEEMIANVSFECIVFRCDLGETGLTDDDLAVSLKTPLPSSCTGGHLIVNPQYDEFFNRGYFESVHHISLDEISTREAINIPIKPYKKVEIDIKKYLKEDLETALELSDDEEVLIQLENKDEDYFEFYVWSKNGENDKINLLLLEDVTYDVNLMITKGELYMGGYKTAWDVSYSDVADNEKVEFPVIYGAVTGDDEMVDLITYIETGLYAQLLKPELI
ncbi:MAG: hypothetical protein U9R08_03060 [Nanoarchaeota archaeon]|nr:hypothetical protein [Nanoarchaeota archaeon]